ncbi:hypothetical protein [Chromobacterium sphagni]|uniref:Lipoprotein n=1 Tax=Chromobacterium sphagni TaxID=1903179 RepID=A0ABX3CHC0_9NEIS|nr:hypothetical protein [Chromobacterium sphagni]OHX21739.1 hypothetical protein BI344_04325 [Chromobacterium sphagni]
MKNFPVLAVCALALSGCAATSTTTLSGSAPNGAVAIYDSKQVARLPLPQTKAYPVTPTSHYEFKASGEGKPSLYGLLPMKYNGGNIAVGILLFPPALLLLHEVYPYYDFDLDQGVVRYRARETDNWTEYKPTEQEANNARRHIDFAASEPVAAIPRNN